MKNIKIILTFINKLKFIFIILIILQLNNCTTKNISIKDKNLSSLYNPSNNFINPETKIYHINDSISDFYIKINPEELYKKKKIGNDYSLKIHYNLFENQNNTLTDSASLILKIDSNLTEPFVITFNLITKLKTKYNLETKYSLYPTNTETFTINYFDKSTIGNTEDFLLKSVKYKTVFFENWFKTGTVVSINSERVKDTILKVNHYKLNNDIALPPFTTTKFKSSEIVTDTSYAIKKNQNFELELQNEGIYEINSNSLKSFTIFSYKNNYPIVETPEKMLGPLRYLTSNKEFKELENSTNPKNSVDEIWLKFSGNPNRAKELIRVYYSRVIFANLYFHSYKEGWLTDRGMIYIIFGAPKSVYKNNSQEKWFYSDSRNPNSLNFTFVKIENKLSDNDYELIRSEIYKGIWHQALDTWRNGRVYSVTK